MTTTVYIPVTINAHGTISDSQAIDIANSIVSMVKGGFFDSDNVYDTAFEQNVELESFKLREAVTGSYFVPRAE